MGIDIHVRVTKYNKDTNLYEEVALFRKPSKYENHEKDDPSYVKASVYDGRDYEMFDGMKDGDDSDGYGYFPISSIALNSYEEKFANEIKEKMSIDGYFDFYEISLSDMKLYTIEHPTVFDFDVEVGDNEPYARKKNPIVGLYENIINYISFADWGFEILPLSYYKIVFYFDC